MFSSAKFLAGTALLALALPAPVQAQVQAKVQAQALASNDGLETVIVTGVRTEIDVPNKIETVTAANAQIQINAVNTEDMLKYVPSITVRKRHYGDTQDPLATRTNGVGASARSLLYVDGILISSPIGNNNTSASPHFGIAAPEDVENFEVLYGPFAAEYGGGSIGAVLNITTRMPDQLEIYGEALGAVESFDQYSTHQTNGTWQLAAGIGDREGAFSWRLSANHLDTVAQPLAYVTLVRPAATSSVGPVITGAFNDVNRTGAPIVEIGAGGIEAQVQDTDTVKLGYDFGGGWKATYTASIFHQTDNATAQTYLRDGSGNPAYSGSANINGYNYTIAASSFSNNVYDWKQTDLAQAVTLKSGSDGDLAWELVASDYNYLDDKQRVPTVALPGATAEGAGTLNRLNGTGWYTMDAKGVWRGWTEHAVSFGVHRDAETFAQAKYNTADWIYGSPTSTATLAKGRTATNALWLQDIWSFAPQWKATFGGRLEDWRAYDGVNFSAAPALNVSQPKISTTSFSPKAALAWKADENWTLSASFGLANRMPTVTELYQAITTGTQLTVPNPNLKPERASSYELAAERKTDSGHYRISLFREDVSNALLSQSAPLLTGSTTLFSFVQNVNRTRTQGVELVADQKDVLFDGLELSGSLTYANGRIVKDTAFAAAVGKFIPQLPKLRGDALVTYHVNDALALTLGGRYSDRSFGTIDNSDPVSQTFQGFAGYFVLDARVHYQWDDNWSVSAGVDNLNNDKYFLFHPFPQRSFVMEIHYAQ
jgi:iron complex outermembrane receptor protein